MKKKMIYGVALTALMALTATCGNKQQMTTVKGGNELITFVGRTDYSNAEAPKQWAAGGYFTFGFKGDMCVVTINDEQPGGENHNRLEIVVDGKATQRALKGVKNIIVIGDKNGAEMTDSTATVHEIAIDSKVTDHKVCICRDTETSLGYTQLVSVSANEIEKWEPGCGLKIEFIGNSITCGAEADTTMVERTAYRWGDWHRAYEGYAPRTARAMDAQWSLVSVSGIGLIRSCCEMGITMPEVYDKMILRENKLPYDFTYQPDIICSCLGQNDHIQDSTEFCTAYVDFIKMVKKHTPAAKVVLLSSPMDHGELNEWLTRMLTSVSERLKADGVNDLSTYFFSKAWNAGGFDHPNSAEHEEIATELTNYLKTL